LAGFAIANASLIDPFADIRDVAVIQASPEARLSDMWGFGHPRVVVTGPRIIMRLAPAASPGEAEEVAGNVRASISARK